VDHVGAAIIVGHVIGGFAGDPTMGLEPFSVAEPWTTVKRKLGVHIVTSTEHPTDLGPIA
jgi:hypothetical protein